MSFHGYMQTRCAGLWGRIVGHRYAQLLHCSRDFSLPQGVSCVRCGSTLMFVDDDDGGDDPADVDDPQETDDLPQPCGDDLKVSR